MPQADPKDLQRRLWRLAQERHDRVEGRSVVIQGLILDKPNLMIPLLGGVLGEFTESWREPFTAVERALTCGEFLALVELFETAGQDEVAAAWRELHKTNDDCNCDED